MKRELIEVGKRYTYHPDEHDWTQHYPCIVKGVTRSGRIQIDVEGMKRARAVSCRAISDQIEMFEAAE